MRKQNRKKRTERGIFFMLICLQMLLSGCGRQEEIFALEEAETESKYVSAVETTTEEELQNIDKIVVYLCGAVKESGVYELDAGSRLYEVLEMAGGCREDASLEAVNQARQLNDGEQIRIPTIEEVEQGMLPESGEAVSDGRVNLNTATKEELTTLKGIGESKAAAVIRYREEHGAFSTTEEIMNISGIGESTYQKIKEQISVG